MPSLLGVRREGEKRLLELSSQSERSAAFEVLLLCEKAFSLPLSQIPAASSRPVDEEDCRTFFGYIERRAAGEPLQYILGEWEFYGLPFYVGKGVLIPRPETELLADIALDFLRPLSSPRILELCAGSGCLSVALAKHLPEAQIWAEEISPDAFSYLERNISRHCADNITPLLADALLKPTHPDIKEGNFSAVLANPPYIAQKELPSLQREVQWEPSLALDGGADGLRFYRELIPLYAPLLSSGGLIAFEIGFDQGSAVESLLEKEGFRDIQIKKDLSGCDRVVCGIK